MNLPNPYLFFGSRWIPLLWAIVMISISGNASFAQQGNPLFYSGQVTVSDQQFLQSSSGQMPVTPGSRPAFLPPPQPVQMGMPSHSAYPSQGMPGASTMTTQLELPLPQPVSQAPTGPLANPAISPVNSSPAFGVQQVSPSPIVPEVSQQIVAADVAPTPVVPQGPAIIFEEEQKGAPAQEVKQEPFDPGRLLREKRYAELEPYVLKSRDGRLATAVGWSLYNDNVFDIAYGWFEKALEWNENYHEAAYGLGLCLMRVGRYEEAEQIARWKINEYPAMRTLVGDIVTAKSVSAYKAQDYERSRQFLDEVKTYRMLTRDEEIMQAWNYFHTGDLNEAADRFEKLYKAKPDRFAANGLYASYARQREWTRLEQLSKTYGGPLAEMYRESMGERYYGRGLYLSAHHTAPKKFPELENIDSTSMHLKGQARYKTGDSGLSKLQDISGRLGGRIYQNGVHRIDASLGVTSLDSGTLSKDAVVGQYPYDEDRRFNYDPVTKYDSMVDVRVRYEKEGLFSPYVEIGTTPTGGAASPTVVGNLGLKSIQPWGSWEGKFYRESIKESILSYTGMKDPYSGEIWGRVVETGMKLSLFAGLQNNWSFYGDISLGVRDGQNVESNNHVAFTLALNKKFEHDSFDYITLGPSITFEHYAKNQSYFTFGQGGYSSPDFLLQGVLSGRFMTKQGKNYLVRGGLALGLQSYRQAQSAFFSDRPDEAVFPETSNDTFIGLANLEALLALNSHWTLGGVLGYNKTIDYSEFTAGLSLQYFFEPREGLFIQDFQ